MMGRIYPQAILLMIISILWSFIRYVFIILIIMLAVRLIIEFSQGGNTSPIVSGIDTFLIPLVSAVTGVFFGENKPSLKVCLIITLAIAVGIFLLLQGATSYFLAGIYAGIQG